MLAEEEKGKTGESDSDSEEEVEESEEEEEEEEEEEQQLPTPPVRRPPQPKEPSPPPRKPSPPPRERSPLRRVPVPPSSLTLENPSPQTSPRWQRRTPIPWPPQNTDRPLPSPLFTRVVRSTESRGLKRVAWPPPPDQPNVVGLPAQGTYDFQQPPTVNTNLSNQQGVPKPVGPSPAAFSQQRSVPPPWENGISGYQPVQSQQAPPPATVALRSEAPIRQVPVQTIVSQPVMKRQAPLRMRGDQKWPPEDYKQLKEMESIPKGPIMRPTRQRKDYSSFFSQNALNPTYAGYRAPPGTQHYIEEGTSNL